MKVDYDPEKRRLTMEHRGLDFEDAAVVFEGDTLDLVADGRDYGEQRMITIGMLRGEAIAVVWTERNDSRRIISMRKASRDEREDYWGHMGRS